MFEEQHTRLRGVVCRITGSVAAADAVVEETWPRRQALPDGEVRDPRPYAGTNSSPRPPLITHPLSRFLGAPASSTTPPAPLPSTRPPPPSPSSAATSPASRRRRRVRLLTGGQLAPGLSSRDRTPVRTTLETLGVRVEEGHHVDDPGTVGPGTVDAGTVVRAGALTAHTRADAAAGPALDGTGRIRVAAALRSVSHPGTRAAGLLGGRPAHVLRRGPAHGRARRRIRHRGGPVPGARVPEVPVHDPVRESGPPRGPDPVVRADARGRRLAPRPPPHRPAARRPREGTDRTFHDPHSAPDIPPPRPGPQPPGPGTDSTAPRPHGPTDPQVHGPAGPTHRRRAATRRRINRPGP